MTLIDTGVRMPEAAHTIANRQAAAHFGIEAGRRPVHDTGARFNEAKYRAERGGYKRHGPGYSLRGEKPAPEGREPFPIWLRRHGFRFRDPNAKAPSSDMKALNEDFRAQHRT